MAKRDKSQDAVARVTAFLTGTVKDKFFEDQKRMGYKETELAAKIIRKHYMGDR